MNVEPGESFFSAYAAPERSPRLQRRYLVIAALLASLGALGYWVVHLEPEATPYRLNTHRGLRTVLRGMTPQEVSSILGSPIARERHGEQDCYQYGRPTLRMPSYVLQMLCYEDSKLTGASEQRYNSWVVTQDGAISPAPLEPDEQPSHPPAAEPLAPPLATPAAP